MEDWAEVNQEIADILNAVSGSGPTKLDLFELAEYTLTVGIMGFHVNVVTAIELIDEKGRTVCDLNADYRYRSEDSFRACVTLGEVVSGCVCDDSGLRIKLESGLALLCRKDDEFENYSLRYHFGKGQPYLAYF